MLLAYAGPASNVRVECASCDCFDDGGALAEVLSVYEGMSHEVLLDSGKQMAEEAKQGNHQLAIGVLYFPFLLLQEYSVGNSCICC